MFTSISTLRQTEKSITVVSIFVNPTQFGPDEDYNKYIRNYDGDMKMLEDLGVDVIFSPSLADMYPDGFETYVELEKLPNHLLPARCADRRRRLGLRRLHQSQLPAVPDFLGKSSHALHRRGGAGGD